MCRIMHKPTDFSDGAIDLKTTPWPLHHSNVGQVKCNLKNTIYLNKQSLITSLTIGL